MKTILSTVTGAGLLLASSTAAADEFGASGTFALGADRLFGIGFGSQMTSGDIAGQSFDSTDSATTIQFFGNVDPFTPHDTPGVGADFFVADNITVGGGLVFLSQSTSSKVEGSGRTTETDGPSSSGVLIRPRGGYAMGLSDNVAIWPRLGFTFFTIGSSSESTDASGQTTTTDTTISGFAVDLEVPLVLMPSADVPVGLTIGPVVDFPLSGTIKLESGGQSQESDLKFMNFGLAGGVVGFI